MSSHLGNLVPVAADETGHEVVVSAQILGAGVVDDVATELERAAQVRTHHRVVDDDDGLGAVPLGDAGDLFEVGDLEERVRRRFEQHHGDFVRRVLQVRQERLGVGRVDMVSCDPAVLLEVADQAVRTAVQVVAGDDLVSRFEQPEDDVEGAHARRDGKGVAGVRDFRNVVFEVRASRVPGPRVVVLPAHALEGRSLVDGHARRAILVLVARIRVVDRRRQGREPVRASCGQTAGSARGHSPRECVGRTSQEARGERGGTGRR